MLITFGIFGKFCNLNKLYEVHLIEPTTFSDENSVVPKIQLSLFQKHKEDFTPGVLLTTHLHFYIKTKNRDLTE